MAAMTAPTVRLPKSPEQVRAAKAARQKRWRDRKAAKAAVAAQIDYATGQSDVPAPRGAPIGMSNEDFATLVKEVAAEQFAAGQLDLRNKDHVPGINAGLKAQGILDARVKAKSKQQTAELAFAIIALVSGQAPVAALPAGDVIEGESVEVD